MAKFNSRSDSGDKGRSREGRKRTSESSEDKKKDGYKAKRSFSKNKVFREIKEERPSGPKRSFGSDEKRPYKKDFGADKKTGSKKPFKREFDKDRAGTDKPKRDAGAPKRPFREDRNSDERPQRSFDDAPRERPFRSSEEKKERKPFREREERAGERPKRKFSGSDAEERKPFREDRDRPTGERGEKGGRDPEPRKSFKKEFKKEDKFGGFKKATGARDGARVSSGDGKKKRFSKPRKGDDAETSRRVKYDEFEEGRAFSKREDREEKPVKKAPPAKTKADDGLIRLNKYLSNAGIASRRDADNLIQGGVVKVNGVVVDQLGYKIKPGDKVTYGDAAVRSERKVYLLLNKPKDYITTVEDPRERKTVMELISGACRERVYPVGRLDRNTTGLLLFTNDGELTTKLTHPKFGVKKVYHVTLNKGLKPDDFKAIMDGIELEDGPVKVDDIAFVGEGKKDVGIEIHSGRNRIVRRIFEHLGYDVIKLDRVVFAGLTKKDLPRGKHRFLTAKEISFLQMIG